MLLPLRGYSMVFSQIGNHIASDGWKYYLIFTIHNLKEKNDENENDDR